jgi:hypothetical protein
MKRALLLGLVLFWYVTTGCAARPAGVLREAIPVPDESSVYQTDARPDGVLGGKGLAELHKKVLEILAARNDDAQADGALGATASWCLNEVLHDRKIDAISIDLASRHFGYAGTVLTSVVFATADDDWRENLDTLPKNVPIDRYGIAVSPRGQSAAILLGTLEAEYETIARSYSPGDSVTFKGRVGSRFSRADVYLTKADGTVLSRPGKNRDFDETFVLETPGKYQLELIGDGATGPAIVSNVPLYVGVVEPQPKGLEGTVMDPEQAELRMFELLNAAREKAGVPPLTADAALRKVALGHSEDMADNQFFSHVSPKTGTPGDRLRRSGLRVSAFGENIAMAGTPEAAHEGLMDSPGHRENMLRPAFTHVGIAAEAVTSGLIVTLNFGRRPPPSAIPKNAAEVEAAIAKLRDSKNLPPASIDPIYQVGAAAGAAAFEGPDDREAAHEAVQASLQREVQRRRTSRPDFCILLAEILETEQLREAPALLDPRLRRIGVGAQLRKDDTGTWLSTVIILEGVECATQSPS